MKVGDGSRDCQDPWGGRKVKTDLETENIYSSQIVFFWEKKNENVFFKALQTKEKGETIWSDKALLASLLSKVSVNQKIKKVSKKPQKKSMQDLGTDIFDLKKWSDKKLSDSNKNHFYQVFKQKRENQIFKTCNFLKKFTVPIYIIN